MSEILDEHVAIIATRAEWAKVACLLGESAACKQQFIDNPETTSAVRSNSKGIDYLDILDVILVENVDTQLRIESRAPPNFRSVKILRSNSTRRSAWEPTS